MSVKFNNYARPLGVMSGGEYYKWRVFVDEPESRLREIQSVQYTLHPTFPEPNQVRTDLQNNFALETAGWGEFKILITIRYRDGQEEKTSYHLDLSKPWLIAA